MLEETRIKGLCGYNKETHKWEIGITNLDDILKQFISCDVTIIIRNDNKW